MNCDGCFNLIDNKCKLGKHKTLGVLLDDTKIVKLNNPCIFKNTEHRGLSFDIQHSLALTRIAVATYFVVRDYEDLDKLYSIMEKEEEFGKASPIGQFNVILKFGDSGFSMSGKDVSDLSMRLSHANKNRLWNIHVLFKNQSIDEFILENCKLPYILEIIEENDFAELQNFKYYCFSNKVPVTYGNIISIAYLRKMAEEQDAELQAEGIV